MKKLFFASLLFTCSILFGQDDGSIYSRLQGIHNSGVTFYNIDAYTISSQTFNYPFTEKGLKKVYRKYSIKKKVTKTKDLELPYSNYVVSDSIRIATITKKL